MKALHSAIGLLLGPLLALWALDALLVSSDSLWLWVEREVPRRVADPFLVEGTLRSAEPGRHNLVVLGNSRADDGIRTGLLERELEPRDLRVLNLTVAGTNVLHQAMMAPALAELEAGLAVLVVDPVAIAAPDFELVSWDYDARVAADVIAPADWLRQPGFHLRGLFQQGHVVARHRQALQYAALVRSGLASWDEIMAEQDRQQSAREDDETRWHQWMRGELELEVSGTGIRAIRALARRLGERGTRLVLVEAPLHPIVPMSLARKQSAEFREQMRDFAAGEGIRFVSADAFRHLEVADFFDLIHLNASGAERFTRDLALVLSPLLESDA